MSNLAPVFTPGANGEYQVQARSFHSRAQENIPDPPPVLRKLGSAPSAVGVSSGQWDLATIRASCQENHLPVTGSSPPGKRYTFSHDGPPVSTAVGPRPEPPTSKCQTQLGRRATAPQHEHPDLHDIRRADVLSWIRQTSIVLIWRHRQTDTRPRRTASIIRPSGMEHSGPQDWTAATGEREGESKTRKSGVGRY